MLTAFVLLAVGLVASPILTASGQSTTNDQVVVAEGEIVNNAVFATAHTVRIEGTVDGDVIVSAARVVVSGTILGNLNAAAAEQVDLEASSVVTGAVHCLCRRISAAGRIDRGLYAMGQTIVISQAGRVHHDVLALGRRTRIDGVVGRDLRTIGSSVDITGNVGGDVRGVVTEFVASARAAIGGDIELTTAEPDAVRINPAATVGGHTRIEKRHYVLRTDYRSPTYYLVEILKLLGAFIVGVILLRWVPRLRTIPVSGTRDVLAALAIGAAITIMTPAVSIFAMLTVVGVPFGILTLVAYAAALYLASIVVAARIGSRILSRTRAGDSALGLLLGLVLLAIAAELPFFGPMVSLAVMVYGVGVMVQAVRLRERSAAAT